MITEVTRIQLEGEQAEVFQALEVEERLVREKRNNMVLAVLAGKGLLKATQDTPGIAISVEAEEIVLTPQQALKLEQAM